MNIWQHTLLIRWQNICMSWQNTSDRWKIAATNYEEMVDRLKKVIQKDAVVLAQATRHINSLKEPNHDQRIRHSE